MRKISSLSVHIDILKKKKKKQIVYYCCLIFTESTVKGFNNKSRVFGGSVLLLFCVFGGSVLLLFWVFRGSVLLLFWFSVLCVLFFFACLRYVSSTLCCLCLWIFHSSSLLRFSLTCIYQNTRLEITTEKNSNVLKISTRDVRA